MGQHLILFAREMNITLHGWQILLLLSCFGFGFTSFYYDDFLKILLVFQTYLAVFRLSICDHYSSSLQFETWISINKIVFMGLYYGSYYPMGPLILAHDNILWISLPSELWYNSTFDVLSNLIHFHYFNSLHQTSVWTPILLQISFYPRNVFHDLCITEW